MTVEIWIVGICLIWSGVSLSGNLVAAPAKFRAANLPISLALEIGRLQFRWIGFVEWCLLAMLTTCLFCVDIIQAIPILTAILIYVFQRLVLLKKLNVRTNKIIANEIVPRSHQHIWFIAAEVAKFIALLICSVMSISTLNL